MGGSFTPAARRIGMLSAGVVAALSLAYAAVLGLGLLSLSAPEQPIGDPWFAVMELLILAMMPALVLLTVAIHAFSAEGAKVTSLAAVVFMAITTGLTAGVHFPILVLGRTAEFQGATWASLVLSFRWPSIAYAIDILAWDLFFPLAALLAAPAFGGNRPGAAIRGVLIASGLLSLAGLSGAVAGDMRLRNIGILGYAVLFPLAAAMMVPVFRRAPVSGPD